MRIGLVSYHSFLNPGGVKSHVFGLHGEFKRRGIYSKIIAPRRSSKENYGRDVILLGTSIPMHFSGSNSDLCVNFNPLAIGEVLKKERFDILHFHNFGFPSTLQILDQSKSLNILTAHFTTDGSALCKIFPGLVYLFEKATQWKIDGVIGVSSLTLKNLKDFKGPKVIIPNAVNLADFSPVCSDSKRIRLLFVGRIEKRKGLIYLLKAYELLSKKHKDLFELTVVGEGDLREECEEYAAGLKSVRFVGAQKKVNSFYSKADIFVSPAIFGESFGIVLLEAMASGVPIVGFANEGYRNLLAGTRGASYLAKPKDIKGLAKRIETLALKPDLRRELRDWGLKEVKKYSWEKVADRILKFYEKCGKRKA